MPTLLGRNYQLKELEAMWGPMYESVLAILGATGTILPIGDPHHGQPDATTFTTVGGEQVTFTWLEAPSAFDTALDLTSPDSFQGIIPFVSFNGTDEEADTPDAAYWTRAEPGNPFSAGFWLNVTDTASTRTLLAKYDGDIAIQEWIIDIQSSDKFRLLLNDDSAGVNATRTADNAINMAEWAFFVVTYDSTGGSDAMGTSGSVVDNATLYQNGSILASTAADNGSYVAMEDGTSTVGLAARKDGAGAVQLPYNGKMAGGPLGPFFTQKELTADEVLRLYELGRRALAL